MVNKKKLIYLNNNNSINDKNKSNLFLKEKKIL